MTTFPGVHRVPPHHLVPFFVQGKYEEADALYLRSIDISEKLLGPDDLEIAKSITTRGNLAAAQARSHSLPEASVQAVRSSSCCCV